MKRRTIFMSAPDFSVSGQPVLISGGTGGIGPAFARAFRSAGTEVTITDIKPPATDEGFAFSCSKCVATRRQRRLPPGPES